MVPCGKIIEQARCVGCHPNFSWVKALDDGWSTAKMVPRNRYLSARTDSDGRSSWRPMTSAIERNRISLIGNGKSHRAGEQACSREQAETVAWYSSASLEPGTPRLDRRSVSLARWNGTSTTQQLLDRELQRR
jgi:hypothetical protein